MRVIVIVLFSIIFVGCATGGKKFAEEDGLDKSKAIVHVYHPDDYSCRNHADPNFLYINNVNVFIFSCDTYTTLLLNPGDYRFSIKKNVFYLPAYENNGAKIYSFEKGKKYYIKYTEDYAYTDRGIGITIAITNSNISKYEGSGIPEDIKNTSYLEPSSELVE